MSGPTPMPPAPSPARRSGCALRGCLLGCLAPVVIGIIALVVARPVLEAKWAAWRADNPWVDVVPGVAEAVGEMVGTSDSSADSAGGRATPLRGVNVKSAMPRDLPLWVRPKAETFNVGDGHAAAYQRVDAPSDSVLGFFRRAMPPQGWRLDRERTGAGGTLLLYRKADRVARVEVVGDTAGTDIWLRSRAAMPPGR